jgi:hypothetical protein
MKTATCSDTYSVATISGCRPTKGPTSRVDAIALSWRGLFGSLVVEALLQAILGYSNSALRLSLCAVGS